MTEKTIVTYNTESLREIPTLGQRKRVRLNGQIETLYVKAIDGQCSEEWSDERDRSVRSYSGTYTLVPFHLL